MMANVFPAVSYTLNGKPCNPPIKLWIPEILEGLATGVIKHEKLVIFAFGLCPCTSDWAAWDFRQYSAQRGSGPDGEQDQRGTAGSIPGDHRDHSFPDCPGGFGIRVT